MAKSITLQLQDIVKKALSTVVDPQKRQKIMIRALLELKDLAAAYPVEGIWNKAPGTRGNNRWYQRGFGSRWKRADGSIGGINNSQRLQRSWQTEIVKRVDTGFTESVVGSAYTEVTYAPFLLDPQKKVNWAPVHGWQDVDEIEKEYSERFEKIVLDEIDKDLRG